jgi:D-glycero-D-manno-heptose 1,7-bisphosphate phosphatase
LKVVFLDRDGVINQNRPDHVKSVDEFRFLPGALASLRLLHLAGWTTIVVTNQAIVHRRAVPQSVVDEINHFMCQQVERHGGRIDAVLCCPHGPESGCSCRKPQPGLLLQAAVQFRLPLNECYLVGDAWTDVAAGQAVGCTCFLVKTGRGQQQLQSPQVNQYAHCQVVDDLAAAARWLIQAEYASGTVAYPP